MRLPRSPLVRPGAGAAAALLLVLGGCNCEGPAGGGPIAGGGGTGGEEKPGSKEKPAPLTAEQLDPVIRELGPAGVLPEQIVVEFARRIRDGGTTPQRGYDGEEGEGEGEGEGEPAPEPEEAGKPKTVLTIVPDVPGTITFPTPSTLAFKPKSPFTPGTTYKVTLEAVETYAGVVKAPKSGAWTREFSTPKFDYVRAALENVDYPKKIVQVALTFSAPMALEKVREHLTVGFAGTSAPDVRVDAVARMPHVAMVTVRNLPLDPKVRGELTLELSPGVPMRGTDRKAGGGSAKLQLTAAKLVTIKKVSRLEGASGHYLEVVCDDDTMADKRYFWDQASSQDFRISRRCMLDDADAAEAIHLEPKTKFTVSPSSGGFRIFGDFKRGSYGLRIDAGARSVDGGVLGSSFDGTFSFPARSPQVQFVSEGRYLPRKAWKSLPVKHLNVDSAELTVREVPQQNLVFWMSDDGNEAASERTSNLILRQKIALAAPADTQTTSWVDVAALVPKTGHGLLELTISSGSARDTARLLLTDMHLVAKRGGASSARPWGEELQVWALGQQDIEPLSGVEMKLIRKSGQVLATCSTDGARGCKLAIPKQEVDPSAPFAILASRGDDFTYLKFKDLEVEVSDAKVGGEPFASDRAYRAAIHGDRGVYRPGETAHLVGILRDRKDSAPKAGMPVELKVVDPRGRELKKISLPVNEAGMVALDLPFGSFAATGRYGVTLTVGNKLAGDYAFQVEEFVPERMKVEAKAERDGYLTDEAVKVSVGARYLFGGIPKDHPVELTCELQPSTFAPKENATFHYGTWRASDKPLKPVALGSANGTLDAEGKGQLTCPTPDANAIGFPGAAKLVAKAAVLEAGSGRTTVGDTMVPMHPSRTYVGLQSGAQRAERGKPFKVDGVTVDWTGNLSEDVKEVELELVRLENEYGWYYDEGEGDGSYQQYQRPVIEAKQKVAVSGGKFSASFTPAEDAGGFLVRAHAGKAQTDLQLDGNGRWYWYEPGEGRADVTPKPLKPTWIKVDAPERVKVGQDVKVKFKAPYRGRVLLTAETDRLVRSEWRAVEGGEASWSFSLDAFSPNVYVSAFLVKDPHEGSPEAFMPDRAFGVTGVAVEPTEFTYTVNLGVPKEIRSNDTLTVNLDVGTAEPGTFATVAAVDEGILQLTKFQTPDPAQILFAPRALGVQTYETVGWTLLLPPGGPSKTTGGDGEGAGAGRVQPVKPVALWSGVVPVGTDGKAKATFQVPTYRGSLRVMAVVAGPKKLGKAAVNVIVRDPLTLQATLPRFLAAGDRIEIPIFLTNLSGQDQNATVSLAVENLPYPGLESAADEPSPVELLGKTEKPLKLKDGESGTVVFRAKALKQIGAAKFKVTAKGGGHESHEEADVPFVPASPRTREVQRIELTGGAIDVKPYLKGWLPTTEQSTLWVTSNPYGEAFDHLKYLVHYPYGCIEQTTSSTWPLLAIGNLLNNVDPSYTQSGKLEEYAMYGINRALSMQTPSGGFGYWPGDTEPNQWASAYATHMLLDAQKLGFPVQKDRLEDAVSYLATVSDRLASTSAVNDAHEPYLQYVLALGGKGRKARVQKLLDAAPKDAKGQRAENVWLLQAALWLAGDHRYEKELKHPDISLVTDERINGWTFYSDRRRRGLMLNTFQDMFGNDPAGEPLANVVAQALQGQRSWWYTTQELSWGITGLGKRVAGNAATFGPVTVTVNGKAAKPVPPLAGAQKKSSDVTFALARASEAKSLGLDLGGKPAGKVFLMLGSEGIKEKADWRVGGEGLKVTRRWLDQGGNEINVSGGHSLGDVVYTELTLTNTTAERVANIALVDRFPAGWEIENPRLGRGGAVEWFDAEQAWNADYLDVRDDKLAVFGSLERGESKKVVYAARAVTAGTFVAPPVEAEAMYDPRIWAREAGRTVVVAGPWEKYVD